MKMEKPEADTGKHDDLVFATGLALMGLDQVDDYEEEVSKRKKSHVALEKF